MARERVVEDEADSRFWLARPEEFVCSFEEITVRVRRLEVEQSFPKPLEEVFAFFSDAQNLDAITPPWLHFRILTPAPIAMHAGALLEYRLRLHGLPIYWRTEISVWEPPGRFVDRQLRGPYRQWIHEHTFEARDGGTWMRDRVDYAAPGFVLEPLLHRLFVGPEVRAIFAYRRQKLEGLLGRADAMLRSPDTPRR